MSNRKLGGGTGEILYGIKAVTETTGTFSYDETSASEQTAFTITITSRMQIGGIWLDMVNVTRNTTIKIKHKTDRTNLRTFTSRAWATSDDDGVLFDPFKAYGDVRVTLECDGAGGGSVNVPYAIV